MKGPPDGISRCLPTSHPLHRPLGCLQVLQGRAMQAQEAATLHSTRGVEMHRPMAHTQMARSFRAAAQVRIHAWARLHAYTYTRARTYTHIFMRFS
eukprot:1151181-Pelagomonas_calceolata.AAC.8